MKDINFLIKPASSNCNLRCKYCFYDDESKNRTLKSMGIMTQNTVDLLLKKAFDAIDPQGHINFAFQGGEPTVVGLEFFREFTRKARAQCPHGVGISFAIQTNGTLVNEDWAEFFHREGFLVGISMDGYKDLHNLHRVDAAGNGSWGKVIQGLKLMKQHRVEVNALCVVTRRCAQHPEKAYRELKKLGFRYIQFIACLDPIGEVRGAMPYSLTPQAYGDFLCAVFDSWYRDWKMGDYHSIRLFEDYVHILLGDNSSTCASCGKCGSYFVVEADGSVYPCDFFALDFWKMGTLAECSLEELEEGEQAQAFLSWGMEKPKQCASCRWSRICNGGCKNDWVIGQAPYNYYCQAFQKLFGYAESRLVSIAKAEQAARNRRNCF